MSDVERDATAPSPPDSPTIQPDAGNPDDVIDLEQHQREKGKRPGRQRKKKKKGSGFEAGRKEPALHEADKDRYDPNLPFDQRLLRCVDEWRSLRSLPFDFKISAESMLFHFRFDSAQLRSKYGRQSLRGFLPDSTVAAAKNEPAGDSEDEDGEADEPEAVVLDTDEEGWGVKTMGVEAIAKWLDDRSNDGYTPTLTVAPTMLSNFLGFMLARNVFPKLKDHIELAIPIADLAKAQLPTSGVLFKLLKHDPLTKALGTLFASPTSMLRSPIADHDEPAAPVKPSRAELLTAADFLGDLPEADLEKDTIPLGDEGWPTAAEATADGESKELKPNAIDPIEQAKAIKKQLEEQARLREAWTVPEQTDQSTSHVKEIFRSIGIDVHRQGFWRVVTEERSARSVVGWEKVDMKLPRSAPTPAVDATQSADYTGSTPAPVQLYRLFLGPHNVNFPLTTSLHSAPTTHSDAAPTPLKAHSLDTPLAILVPASAIKTAVKGVVFEADISQVRFDPAAFEPGSGSAAQRRAAEEQWRAANEVFVLRALHRILPSYYRHAGEYIRDEPGRDLSFAAGWGPAIGEKVDGEHDTGLWPSMSAPSRIEVIQKVDAGEVRSPQSNTGIRGRSKGRRGRGGRRGGSKADEGESKISEVAE